jgi:hypothetical protein
MKKILREENSDESQSIIDTLFTETKHCIVAKLKSLARLSFEG